MDKVHHYQIEGHPLVIDHRLDVVTDALQVLHFLREKVENRHNNDRKHERSPFELLIRQTTCAWMTPIYVWGLFLLMPCKFSLNDILSHEQKFQFESELLEKAAEGWRATRESDKKKAQDSK